MTTHRPHADVPLAHLSHPKYRADIDGLRALAVLAVVVFHAFPARLKGGFIGVDVFFVISGYLISTIIFDSLERGTFSFAAFYARRIRRIFPALLLVLASCLAFGWFALLADEYRQLGKHVAGGAGFVSNLMLWTEAGYFDNASDTKPLLHLWSLGIEEQFYFAWPLLLWLAWKRRLNLVTVAIVLALLSFVLSLKGVHKDTVAAFYSPVTRFWELACGGLLAWASRKYREYMLPLLERLGVPYFDPFPYLCRGATCLVSEHGRIYYADEGHLSEFGGQFLETQGKAQLDRLFGQQHQGTH